MGPAEDASNLVVEKPSERRSMKPNATNYPPFLDEWSKTSAISNLPLELISIIAGLSLPKGWLEEQRIKALYSMRMVSRKWRNAIDSTPSLWNVITFKVPLHVNTIAIQRSGDYPLDVYITYRTQTSGFIELLELASREIRRWSTVTLRDIPYDVCSKYLTSPAPLLRSLHVALEDWVPSTPVALFKGIAPRLEKLEVARWPMDWTSPFIHGLKALDLVLILDGQISTQQVLDIISSIPFLEKLGISYSSLDHHLLPPRPSTIQLPSLNTIDIEETNLEAIRIILASIRAPNCTSLRISEGEDDTVPGSNFLDDALGHFKDFQRAALSANERSVISFSDGGMQWDSESTGGRLWFGLDLQYDSTAIGVGWATSVIGTAAQELVHDLEVTVSHEELDDEDMAAYLSFSHCQSITTIEMDYDNEVTPSFLDLLGTWNQSEDGVGQSPAFPGLELLVLGSSKGWSLDDLEILVERRFGTQGEVPDLRIVLPELDSFDSRWNMAQLQRLRTASGVTLDIGNPTSGSSDDDEEL